MRVLLQRVDSASVTVNGKVVGAVGPGLMLFVGFGGAGGGKDPQVDLEWMADKVVGLRVFPDERGRMNRSLNEVGGGLLVVSQFTLYGDVAKGRRPSFVKALAPTKAEALYEDFVEALRERAGGRVETGRFGAYMLVESVNAGPVTLWLER